MLLALAVLLSSLLLPGTAHATDEYLPPSETIEAPYTDDCRRRELPPPPVDQSEEVGPGETSPAPLPVPAEPIGGARLGECGYVLPAGASGLPGDISAAAWLIADIDTGEVLAAKDPHGRYRPASTLKLLTALTILENVEDLDQVVIGTQEDANQEGSRVGIGPGGEYTVRQLLLFMMMGSGNDTAYALARVNGGFDKTVADMNALAARIGAADTRAATVSGLDGPGQVTSVHDLALITRAAMAHPEFPPLVSTPTSMVPGFGEYDDFGIANDNKLLHNYPGALGGKTGFTDDAGNTYVGMAEQNGRRLVVTLLGGTQYPRRQWMQAASLLDWGFGLSPGTPAVGEVLTADERTGPAPEPEVENTAPPVPTQDGAPAQAPTDAAEPAVPATSVPAADPQAGADEPAATADQSASAWGSLGSVIAIGCLLLFAGAALLLYLTRPRRPQRAEPPARSDRR